MKKLYMLAAMVLGLAAASQAQIEGFGWDNGSQEVVGRLGIGGYSHVEVGVGALYDGGAPDATVAQEDARFTLSMSGRFLLALHQWDKFTGYLHAGLYFRDDNNIAGPIWVSASGRAAALSAVVAYQPEVTLFQHLAVSTLLGASLPITPDVKFGIVGQGVSIVEGFNFRILF